MRTTSKSPGVSEFGMDLRKRVRNLSDKELKDLRNAYGRMMQIRDNRGFNYVSGFHGAPGWYSWHHQQTRLHYRDAPLFLPWNRAYIYRFERAVQDQVTGVTVPWWDWSSPSSRYEGIPKAFSDETIDGSHLNPLYKSHIHVPTTNPPLGHDTFRSPRSPSELPTCKDIIQLLSVDDFRNFSDMLEDINDHIHMWIGGSMQIITTAAFDPIFYSNYCMIDRVWWLWQLQHRNSSVPPNMLDLVLEPFNLTVRDVLNICDLGYDYASS
jgi:tyrosinase